MTSEFVAIKATSEEPSRLENEQSLDIQWWNQKNYKECFAKALTSFYERDVRLITQDKEFSILNGISDRRLSDVAKKIQDQLGVEDLRTRAEIILTLRNAQLSLLTDEVTLTLLKDRPMPVDEFETRLTRIVRNEETIQKLVAIYRNLLRQYKEDLSERAHEEPVADFIIRTADAGRISADWKPYTKSEKALVGETLQWIQTHWEAGDLVRDVGPKAGKTIERDVALIKLPFIDVLACEGTNFYLKQFNLTAEAQSRGVTHPEGYADHLDLSALYTGDACINYTIGQRALITFTFDSIGPPRLTEQQFEEQAIQSFAHVRHEMKHYIDKKIRDEKQTGFADTFYYPEGSFPMDGKGPRMVEEAIAFETQSLLDEAKALCLDGKLLSLDVVYDDNSVATEVPLFNVYLKTAIYNLRHQTRNGDSDTARIQAFWDSWQDILDFLKQQTKILGDVSEERENRFINLVLYHCIATAETSEDLLIRLKHGVAWVMTELE